MVFAQGLVGNRATLDLRRAISSIYPETESLSIPDLEAASAKFRYRSILRFLSSDEVGFIKEGTPFLPGIVPAYAELSSFVHGGPWSDRDMQTYSKPEALDKCREKAGVAFMMAASVFMFTALAVSREFPTHGALAGQTKEIVDRFQASVNSSDA